MGEEQEGKKKLFPYARYTSEAMESNVVDVKADGPNGRSMARIKSFDQETTASHLFEWLLWMKIKHYHRKNTMTHTQNTCPNCFTVRSGKKRLVLLKLVLWPQSSKNQRGGGGPRGVMVKAMDCGIVVREFVLQSRYTIHFRANTLGKGMKPPYPPSYWLNSTSTVLLGE